MSTLDGTTLTAGVTNENFHCDLDVGLPEGTYPLHCDPSADTAHPAPEEVKQAEVTMHEHATALHKQQQHHHHRQHRRHRREGEEQQQAAQEESSAAQPPSVEPPQSRQPERDQVRLPHQAPAEHPIHADESASPPPLPQAETSEKR